jgi:hypothetical protein
MVDVGAIEPADEDEIEDLDIDTIPRNPWTDNPNVNTEYRKFMADRAAGRPVDSDVQHLLNVSSGAERTPDSVNSREVRGLAEGTIDPSTGAPPVVSAEETHSPKAQQPPKR